MSGFVIVVLSSHFYGWCCFLVATILVPTVIELITMRNSHLETLNILQFLLLFVETLMLNLLLVHSGSGIVLLILKFGLAKAVEYVLYELFILNSCLPVEELILRGVRTKAVHVEHHSAVRTVEDAAQ
jgi:hypothetical protein